MTTLLHTPPVIAELDFYQRQARRDHDTFIYDGEAPLGSFQKFRADFVAWYYDGGRLHSGVQHTALVAHYHRYMRGICAALASTDTLPHIRHSHTHTHRWMVWMGREIGADCWCAD